MNEEKPTLENLHNPQSQQKHENWPGCSTLTGVFSNWEIETYLIVLIPIIKTKHHDEQFIEWSWCQLPVTPAFAMTIDKSQGQTPKVVGVRLEEPTFTHEQLHVAALRVGYPRHPHFAERLGILFIKKFYKQVR